MTSKPLISGVTVSVNFGDKNYGSGSDSFMNLKADYDPGVPPENLDDVVDQGLDLYLAAWKTLLSARYATGVIVPDDYKKLLEASIKRIALVRKFLRKSINEQQ